MRRAALILLALSPLLVSAADPVAEARHAAAAAAREQQRLEQAAADARSTAEQFRMRQAAAAAAIIAAESRIEAAEAEARRLQRRLAAAQEKLDTERRPAALLLGGLAHMSRRPPLLALADDGSAEEFVRIRALLRATLPAIEARTAALRGQLTQLQRLAEAAAANRAQVAEEQAALLEARQRFAALEAEALARAAGLGGEALFAGDLALGEAEQAARLGSEAQRQAAADRLAQRLAQLPAATPRPSDPEGASPARPLAWHLPVRGRVTTGLFEVSDNGVRSRGLTISAGRGAAVAAPAAGRIVFAGPFRRRDGVVIIDHGGGWMTLMTDVRPALAPGARVAAGAAVGRALGPVTVELTRNGAAQPAALIARSSSLLSKNGKSG
jgi:septal ring factor EnvC (AmiA/AmiB activator)